MMGEDKRQHKCTTPGCDGVVYIEGDKVRCTGCAMMILAKRKTDDHLMTFRQLAKEFNG